MEAIAADEIFLFEGFRLDLQKRGVFRAAENGDLVPLAVGSRALDLLVLLVRRHGDLVSKEEIMTTVWPGVIVEDSNLPTQISTLRRVLDQGRVGVSCIQTVSGRGYRFVAPVTHPGAEGLSVASADGRDAPARTEHARRAASGAREAAWIGGPSRPWRRPLDILAAPAVIKSAFLSRGQHRSGNTGPPRLSIVVLPFLNLTGRTDQQFVADRITDDLTTALSRFTGMMVISRSTAFTYRNKPVEVKRIGHELGVRYVLEGSVHRSANHLRINAQLIDATADTHLWAERFECDVDDLFVIQDEITKRTAVALYTELIATEGSRPTEHPDAIEYILRARAVKLKPLNRGDHAEAISLFERALAQDPQSAEAQAWLALSLAERALDELAHAAAADIARAAELATQALAASPRGAFAHVAKGRVLCAQSRFREATLEYEIANALNRSWPHIYGALSECKFWSGSVEEAIPLAEQAISIHPHDGFSASWYFSIGRAHLVQSRTEEAIVWLEKTLSANSESPTIHAWLASAYALSGEIERAISQLAEARALSRDGRYSSIARLQHVGLLGVAEIRGLLESTYLAGLRKAGMPE
jgi:TolB-like protein/DNA-binding winged helix-turn-helix (wHTH) protein/Flp pilus assembly protein TadD